MKGSAGMEDPADPSFGQGKQALGGKKRSAQHSKVQRKEWKLHLLIGSVKEAAGVANTITPYDISYINLQRGYQQAQ